MIDICGNIRISSYNKIRTHLKCNLPYLLNNEYDLSDQSFKFAMAREKRLNKRTQHCYN